MKSPFLRILFWHVRYGPDKNKWVLLQPPRRIFFENDSRCAEKSFLCAANASRLNNHILYPNTTSCEAYGNFGDVWPRVGTQFIGGHYNLENL